MDTPFEKLENDTKEDWRGHPATRAYLETLNDQILMLSRAVIDVAQTPGDLNGKLHVAGGEVRGLVFAFDMAARR